MHDLAARSRTAYYRLSKTECTKFRIISNINIVRKGEYNRLAGRKCGISSTLNYLNKCKLNSTSWHARAYKSDVTTRIERD